MSELEETKKKEKCSPYNSMYVTMGDPAKDMEHFNQTAGTADNPEISVSGEGIGLTEDRIFAPKAESYYELPNQVHLLDKSKVSEFIAKLQPGEEFEVGYVTPVYFYKKLEKFFTLIKCTEFVGCTGIDYWDMSGVKYNAPTDRVAKSAGQIADPNGETKYFTHNGSEEASEKGKAWSNSEVKNVRVDNDLQNKHKYYGDVNKTVMQDDRIIYEYTPDGKIVKDKNGAPVVAETVTDLKTILFYPKVGSRPTVHYFLDLKNGEGYFECDRKTIEETIYRRAVEVTTQGLLAKKLNPHEDMTDEEITFIGTLMDKVQKVIETDAQTIHDKAFGTSDMDKRPDCRALYTNQIYYLAPGVATFTVGAVMGNKLDKFTEGYHLDEAKRYVRRYYIKPQNIFCSNKTDIIKALIDIDKADCTIYTLNNLGDEKDVTKLTSDDIIYTYKDEILYDKNGVKVMDYDLYIKHEEKRDEINPNAVSDAKFNDVYHDRITDADLTSDGDDIKRNGTNTATVKEELEMDNNKLYYFLYTDEGYDFDYSYMIIAHNQEEADKIYEAKYHSYDRCKQLCAIDDPNAKEVLAGVSDTWYHFDHYTPEEAEAQYEEDSAKLNSFKDSYNPFEEEFEDVNAFGESLKLKEAVDNVCCICGEPLDGYGNNAEPYARGECCDACNMKFVIPARLAQADADYDDEDK